MFSENDKIYATGVYLQPVKAIINGIEQWRWVAVGFEDDSFFDGETISVYDYADTLEGLINENFDDDE
ncbi:MAG TPA: hypothetical protein PK762_08920 [Candidatus Kapabacteria bacterium]|nr:hypothetical protein [Candidatus Kapabacteria bacterium]